MLSPLFAAERAVYLHARAIAEESVAHSPPREHSPATGLIFASDGPESLRSG
jgi:hypothetical protein